MSWKICVSHLFHAFSHTMTNDMEALSQLLAGMLGLLAPRRGLFWRHDLQPLAHGCRGDVFICQYRPIVHRSLRYGSRNVKMQHIVTCFQMLSKDCRISLHRRRFFIYQVGFEHLAYMAIGSPQHPFHMVKVLTFHNVPHLMLTMSWG